jgi:V8-like Glu-specific endopeptidase
MNKKGSHSVHENSILYHEISTGSGNSGSPIMIKKSNEFFVIAIHKGALPKINKNAARLITQDLFANLIRWEYQFWSNSIINF